MNPDTQPLRTPKGKISKARKRRVDEVQKLDLVQMKRDGFFESPLGTGWYAPAGPITDSTACYASLRLEPDVRVIGIFVSRDCSITDWDLDYYIALTPTPCPLRIPPNVNGHFARS